MRRIAKFSKISEMQWAKDWLSTYAGTKLASEDIARKTYDALILPERATAGSAGYDFHTPVDIDLMPGESVKFPTGIRCRMEPEFVLLIVPRSSLGFRYSLQLNNTVGVIDSDYYDTDNEGHIFMKLTNANREGKEVHIKAGQAVAQGIFVMYGITEDDAADAKRNGGFGSTDK